MSLLLLLLLLPNCARCSVATPPAVDAISTHQPYNHATTTSFHISASGGGGGGGSAGTGACDGSSFNSTPLDSPLGADDTLCTDRCDVPLSMNAALLQRSAESLSTGTAAATAAAAAAASVPPAGRRQVRLMTDTNTSGCDRDPCGSCGPQSYQHPVVVGSSCSSSPVLSLAHVHCALPAPRSHCCQQLHTPETPSANITRNSSSSTSTASSTSSMNSQAFTSHFNSETSLLLPQSSPPSAILTPSTDASHANINMLSDEPWDLTNFEYEFTLNIDDYFK